MTIRAHYAEPCWEIVRVDTKRPPEEDGWAHYKTEDAALGELADRQDCWGDDVPLTVQRSFPTPCFGLFCDGPQCGAADEPCDMNDEGWTHLDPSDPLPFPISEMEWFDADNGKHYCPGCTPPWCDDCGEQHAEGECPIPPARRPVPVSDDQLTLGGVL